MILVITSSIDKTVDYLTERYKLANEFFRFDTDNFFQYEIDYSDDWGFRIEHREKEVAEPQINSIYYRKPMFRKVDGVDPVYFDFQKKEIYGLISGLVNQFDGKVLTKPNILNYAGNKIVQLKVASKIGFRIPRTRITNSKKFLQELGEDDLIIKPIQTGKIETPNGFDIIHTNRVDPTLGYNNLNHCPSIFQEYIDKEYELRVTLINDHFYCVKLNSQETRLGRVDWRKDADNLSYELVDIPSKIRKMCKEFLEIFGLKFGAFDFIVNHDKYTFLEVNVNGQWLWLELRLNLDISRQIVKYLAE